jgi:uncharacterized protein DUF6677
MNISLFADIIMSWLIPGFGFFRRGRYIRALMLFAAIEGTFIIGFLLKGSIVLPVMDFSGGGLGGGVISLLTFVIQMGNGFLGILSFSSVQYVQNLTANGIESAAFFTFLSGKQEHSLFEMGGFYMLVAGAMNYFAVTNFFDRYRSGGNGSIPSSKNIVTIKKDALNTESNEDNK